MIDFEEQRNPKDHLPYLYFSTPLILEQHVEVHFDIQYISRRQTSSLQFSTLKSRSISLISRQITLFASPEIYQARYQFTRLL